MIKSILLGKGEEALEIKVKITSRAKRISIKISSNFIELIIPSLSEYQKGYEFLLQKELWLRNKLKICDETYKATDIPDKLSILGKEYKVILGDCNIKQPILVTEDKILVSKVIPEVNIKKALLYCLKKIAQKEIENYTALKSKELNLKYNRVSVKDTSSRWGSCSSSGGLSFSWRLILAPRFVMEYVVVHELCHTLEMNHSIKFWSLVGKFFPNYNIARDWLKKNGRKLHRLLTKSS